MRRACVLVFAAALASAAAQDATDAAPTPAVATRPPTTALPPAPPGNNAARAPVVPPPTTAGLFAGSSTAGTSAVVALRTAADGSACRLPVVVGGSLVVNCTTIRSTPNACLVAGDPLPRPCAPPSGDELPLAAALSSGSAGDGAPGALCALTAGAPGVLPCGGGTTCEEVTGEPRLKSSPYGYCALNRTAAKNKMAIAVTAPPPAIAAAAANAAAAKVSGSTKAAGVTVASRATVTGSACRLPLFYGGVLLTDCVPLGGGADPACFTKGTMGPATCVPPPPGGPTLTSLASVLTASPPGDRGFGALCALPKNATDTTSADCLPGLLCVPMATGPLAGSQRFGFCAGAGIAPGGRPAAAAAAATTGDGAAPASMLVARQRRTVGGAYCRLPLYVNGTLLADCTAMDGATACYTGSALIKKGICAPAQDDWASVPLASLLEAGTAGDGGLGALCALPPARGGAAPKWPVGKPCSPEYACLRARAGPLNGSSTVGVCSATPATPAAAAAAAAADAAGKGRVAPQLDAASARAALANSTLLVARRRTVAGDLCRLPIVLASGKLAVDCRPLGGFATPACYTDGLAAAAPCAPAPADAKPRTFASMLAAGGGGDGGPGSICSVFGGTMSGAMPATPCGAGLKCVPFAGDFGYCAAAAVPAPPVSAGDAPPALPPPAASLAAVDVARRTTVTGFQCRLPVRVAGALVTDCASLQGAPNRCFVDGNLTITHPCAMPKNTSTPLPLVALEADGRLSDGRRGALCHLSPPPASAVGATAVKCKPGLECVSFDAAPLAGTRFGWCKRVGVPAVGGGAVAKAPAAAAAAGTSGERGPPSVLPTAPANRTVTARTPFLGAPVYDHAPNLGSSYYCGPSCVFGSLLAMAATVLALAFVCVLACRRGGGGGGGGAAEAGPPAGAFTAASPPPAAPAQQAPAAGRPGGGIALSLRPTRYERFEDAEAGPPAGGGGAAATGAATTTANPFAPPPPPAQPAAGSGSQPVQLSFTPLSK